MDVSLVIGVTSIVLAIVAILYGFQAERKSTDNYNRTKDVLSEISQKAAVIEGTVSNTQKKLVDTVTAIARPKEETQEDKILQAVIPSILQNPQMLERLVKLSENDSTDKR